MLKHTCKQHIQYEHLLCMRWLHSILVRCACKSCHDADCLLLHVAAAMQGKGSYRRSTAGVVPNGRSTKGQYGQGCHRQSHLLWVEPATQSGQAHHVRSHHVLQMTCIHVPHTCYKMHACPCAALAVSSNDIYMCCIG